MRRQCICIENINHSMLPVGNCSSLNSIEVRKFYFMVYELPLYANLISINIVLSH